MSRDDRHMAQKVAKTKHVSYNENNMFKAYVRRKLERYVKKYFKTHPEVKLIVVAGSVGKTSTKRAIATLLSRRYRVGMHDGNHNTEISVPLGILGIKYPPNIHNPLQWRAVFKLAEERIKNPSGVDVIVQELGTDHPGDIMAFGRYLKPDTAVITAVTPEHMEYFGTIEAVAQEEMSVATYSQTVLINHDDIEGRFAEFITNPNFATYGLAGLADFRFEQQGFTLESGFTGTMIAPGLPADLPTSVKVYGEHSLRPIVGAVAVAVQYGLTPAEIQAGLQLIRPVPGRMNVLAGIGGTTIIDDTYNSSPAAASAAIQSLYLLGENAPQRVALLGDMRELGASSQIEHEKIGAMCDPQLLEWVVTVGPESERYLAPIARQRGCQVKSFHSALEAGAFARSIAREGAVILVKGSQNTIYLEEAVKILCDLTEDDELVRQTPEWIKIKSEFFSRFK